MDPEPEGRLIGMVADLNGHPVPSVPITLASGRKKWTTLSDDEGFYQLPLPAGRYKVDVKPKAWITYRHDEVWIVSGQSTYLPSLYWPGWTEPVVFGFNSPNQYRAAAASIPPLGTALRRSGGSTSPSGPTLIWLPDALLEANGKLTVDIPLPPDGTRWHIAALASDSSGHITTAATEWVVESNQ